MRQKSQLKPNAVPLVIYDTESIVNQRCSICHQSHSRLLNPCQCAIKYHQRCLLRRIQEQLLIMRTEIDMSLIRCQLCRQQIRFLYSEGTHYSCAYFCPKFRRNWCNKSVICMFLLTVAAIVVGIFLSRHGPEHGPVYYGLLGGETLICLVLLALTVVFVQGNLMYKEITLIRVYEYVEARRNSTDSEDSPGNTIHSENFHVRIEEQEAQ